MTTEAENPSNGGMSTEEANTAKEHEDPSLSSASLAIEFEMLGVTFRPVFTHQAFPGEHIRGYHPPLKTMMEFKDKVMEDEAEDDTDEPATVLLHSSHIHHQAASKELSIQVQLAPSCQTCQVELDTEQKRLPRRRATRRAKRRRVNNPDNDDESNTSKNIVNKSNDGEDNAGQENSRNKVNNIPSDEDQEIDEEDDEEDEEASYNDDDDDEEEEEKDDSEFEVDDESEVEQDEEQKEGSTRGARMPTKEILHNLKKGLPTVVGKDKQVQDDFLRRPLGVELKEYTVNNKDNDEEKTFVLCLADGPQVVKYHTQVQRLALWFIETADEVDVSSQEGGYWKVLYLFQKHKRTQYSLAGYVTLFHFHAPFKKPKPGIVVRICQALVLPPFQRSGHGKHMLTCLMDIAHGLYASQLAGATKKSKASDEEEDDIVEINVESPAPAFVMLRNRTDLDCFVRSLESNHPWVPHNNNNNNNNNKPPPSSVTDPDFFSALSETELAEAAATAKIIPRQIQIVMELYKLHQLQKHFKATSDDNSQGDKDELEKRFRLMVKKRLNREHREDLSGFRTKAEKQAFLDEEFKKCHTSYLVTLPK